MGIIEAISAVGGAIKAVFNWITGRQDLNNQPPIVDNTTAASDNKETEEDKKAVAEALKTGNLDELRKRGSTG